MRTFDVVGAERLSTLFEMEHRRYPATAPVMPSKDPVQVYFLSTDKKAIEVRAAGELNRAVKDCAALLAERGTAGSRLASLGLMLRGLDRDHVFSTDQRGNARQLCSEVRLFAEAAYMSVKPYVLERECSRLRLLTRWACHPPLTKSKLEYWTHKDQPDGKSKSVYEEQQIGEKQIMDTAAGLRSVVDGLLQQRSFRDASPVWQLSPAAEGLERARAKLDEAVAVAKDGFAGRRGKMRVKQHGLWEVRPVSTFHKHALLLFEAEEHLVASRLGSAKKRGLTLAARELCLGIRMFAEKAGQVMYRMPLHHSGGGLRNVYELAGVVLKLTHWSAHADTWRVPNSQALARATTLTVDAKYLEDVTAAFNDLCVECHRVLDFFAEPERCAVLDLGERAATEWRVALYLGLMLKDFHKEKSAMPPGAVVEAAAAGPDHPEPAAVITNGVVGFHTYLMLPDSERMLRLAEAGSRAAVDSCTVDDPASDELLDYDTVAAKELKYVCDTLARTGYVVAPLEKRTSQRKASKEITMQRLGEELLGLGRPRTAQELVNQATVAPT